MKKHDMPTAPHHVRGNQLMISKVFACADAARSRVALRDLFDKPSQDKQKDKRVAAQLKRERKMAKRTQP